MRCKPAEKLLLDHIEGTLPLKLKDRLADHLGDCLHCQDVLDDFDKTIHLANSLPVKYSSPEAWEDFWPKLRSNILQGPVLEDRLWLRTHKWKIASAACMLIALLGFGGLWSYGLFNFPTADRNPSLDERIIQNFMGDASAKHLQELLNQELQLLDGMNLTCSGEDLLMVEIGLRQSAGPNSLVSQLFEVIVTEIDREYFEDDELTDLVKSMGNKLTLASLR